MWTHTEYDWKGRTIRTINTDGTDTLASYEGCGCAGGQVTTIQSELVPRDDQPNVNARRTQKIYEDILGRTYKTETLKWDGTIYSTVLTNFNGRDQAVSLVEQDNSQSPVVSQTTTLTYDGHGRLKSRKLPQQSVNTATVYNYRIDDSIENVVTIP